jgi:tetratricopeptide (TPR) repeat protein
LLQKSLSAVLVTVSMVSCSTNSIKINPAESDADRAEVNKADQLLLQGKFDESLRAYDQYINRKQFTIYFLQAKLGKAASLRQLGQCSDSLNETREVLAISAQDFPKIAGQALVESSYCYEVLGNNIKQLASLQDAYKFKSFLPTELAIAEVPARLAASHAKLNQFDEAKKYLNEAQRGALSIENLNKTKDAKLVLSKIYYDMGSIALNQLSIENMRASIEAVKTTQEFLLKSAELEQAPWSQMASQKIVGNFNDFWQQIQKIPISKALDPEAAERNRKDLQEVLTGDMLAAIQSLKNYRADPSIGKSSEAVVKTFIKVEEIENTGLKFLNELGSYMNLTKEAQRFHQLKREGVIKENLGPVISEKPLDPNL